MILTEVGYRKQTEHTSGGLSDTFQTTGRHSDFRPNHRWAMCNYPKILNTRATITVHICTSIVAVVHLCTLLHPLM